MNSSELGNIVTSFTLYKFLDALTTPFTQTQAYRLGIIDANGNILKQVDKLNSTEKAAFNEFYRLVYSLKRLLIKVPDPDVRARLTNIPGAIKLIAEQCESIGGNAEDFYNRAIREMYACRLMEDGEGGVANSMGGGFNVANPPGIPSGNSNIAGYDAPLENKKKPSIFKRKKPNKYWLDAEQN